jgi:hypothetical protein
MLIARLIGGANNFLRPSYSGCPRRPPHSPSSSRLSSPWHRLSLVQQIEDAFFFSSASIDSTSFYTDIVFAPSPAVTDLDVYHPPFQHSTLDFAASTSASAGLGVQEVGQEKCFPSLNGNEEKPTPASTPYSNAFLLLALPCAILTLYLTYVSCPISKPAQL